MEKLKHAWASDPLGVVGVGAALAAVASLTLPFSIISDEACWGLCSGLNLNWGWFANFSPDGEPFAEVYLAALLAAISVVALLYRAGNAANRPK